MKNRDICTAIVPRKPLAKQSRGQSERKSERRSPQQQLELFAAPDIGLQIKARPQISSVPGVSPKDPKRYRVKVGDKVLGDRLSLDEALKLAKRGGR